MFAELTSFCKTNPVRMQLIDPLGAHDLCFPVLRERDDTVQALLGTDLFNAYLGPGSGLPDAVDWRFDFPALLTTPGAGKSRLLHEFCAHSLVRKAAQNRGVDIVPLHITFNCLSALVYPDSGQVIAETELAARILLDAFAVQNLDDRCYPPGLTCAQALRIWVVQRLRRPSRDVVIVMCVDEITFIKVTLCRCFQ